MDSPGERFPPGAGLIIITPGEVAAFSAPGGLDGFEREAAVGFEALNERLAGERVGREILREIGIELID